MKKPSGGGKLVRYAAADIPPASSADLTRLRKAANAPVRTSDIAEWSGSGPRVLRDAQGRLVKHAIGPIAQAILDQLDRRQMTRYRLWRNARVYRPTLSESAVYGFLGGTRQIEVPYAEALLKAAGLTVTRSSTRRSAAKKSVAAPAGKITPATAKKAPTAVAKPAPGKKTSKKSLA